MYRKETKHHMMGVALCRAIPHIAGMKDDITMQNDASQKAVQTPRSTLSAEELIRMQPLNPFRRLEFSPLRFREVATIPLEGPI